ncbi:MAG TPA: hypothetical protein VGD95_06645 [Micavibrio sp.]
MNAFAKNIISGFDADLRAREQNERRLSQVEAACRQGRDVTFPDSQKHMRFSWKKAAAPMGSLVESLYEYFDAATAVTIVGGGAHPFDKESVQLTVDIAPVAEVIFHEGMGSGLAVLGRHLESEGFHQLCQSHEVSAVFTPSNDLQVGPARVQHHNHPRPL